MTWTLKCPKIDSTNKNVHNSSELHIESQLDESWYMDIDRRCVYHMF